MTSLGVNFCLTAQFIFPFLRKGSFKQIDSDLRSSVKKTAIGSALALFLNFFNLMRILAEDTFRAEAVHASTNLNIALRVLVFYWLSGYIDKDVEDLATILAEELAITGGRSGPLEIVRTIQVEQFSEMCRHVEEDHVCYLQTKVESH
ncbi:hypothetical protein NEOLI_004357 [Neolecta irregularis DAH-3]|uniref:Uncharacterized protein n=1 Tax=Neolecta irregularis (strain DAH-3) TaxID=1198029 RepID=A0A1U7LMG9_NEOID|nr:hypothetical protein NEOLI_004357 [Neolecta irregularis DAH-3]|eukprot:OLL23839.1 hypothetical protein NEOLI_004357 [Neolecta irregularis DAH-3]